MALNQEYVLKRGEVGSLLEFTLSDSNGPVNLNGWTVEISARRGAEPLAIDGEACAVAANQATTGKGKGTYEFSSGAAAIPAGTYDLEFRAVSPTGDVYYFPKSRRTPYAKLLVLESLG